MPANQDWFWNSQARNLSGRFRDEGGHHIDVMSSLYGAVGDGSTDDAPAINAAIADGIAQNLPVFFPPPPGGQYVIKSPLLAQATSLQKTLIMRGTGNPTYGQIIVYKGPSFSSVFQLLGIQHCWFQKISIQLDLNISNCVVWDQQFTAQFPNAGFQQWDYCNVIFNTNPQCTAWRFGQASGGSASNGYSPHWNHCIANDQTTGNACVGWQIGGTQNYSPCWINCTTNMTGAGLLFGAKATSTAANVGISDTTLTLTDTTILPSTGIVQIGSEQIFYTSKTGSFATQGTITGCIRGYNQTVPASYGTGVSVSEYVPGQGAYVGNCSGTWIGGGLGGIGVGGTDIMINTGGGYLEVCGAQNQASISLPRRALQIGTSNSNVSAKVHFRNVAFKNYASPPDGQGIITCKVNPELKFMGCDFPWVNGGAQYSNTNYLATFNNSQAIGSCHFEQCSINGIVPFIQNTAGIPITFDHCQLYDNTGHIISPLNQTYLPPITLTDAATVTLDLSQGNKFLLPMGNALGNRTIAFSNAGLGIPRFTLYLQQPSSGSAQTVTWPTVRWQGGTPPTLSATNNTIDRIDFDEPINNTYLGTVHLGY